jgi:hypothetical protein
MNNLINDPKYLAVVGEMRNRLFQRLQNRDGEHVVPYTKKFSSGAVYRHEERSKAAPFPEDWQRLGDEDDLRNFMTPDAARAKGRKAESH